MREFRVLFEHILDYFIAQTSKKRVYEVYLIASQICKEQPRLTCGGKFTDSRQLAEKPQKS